MAKSPWMPEFYRDPGPTNKQGYWFQTSRTQAQTEGGIYHDSVGGLAGTLRVLHGSVMVSWTGTIDVKAIVVNGKAYLGYQHYPLWGQGSITFHAGIVGDLDDHTAVVGNLALAGFEFCRPTGNAAAKWTDFQVEAAAYTWDYYDRPEPFELANNAWEHNWLKNTACPSNRNRWDAMEQALEDDMGWSDDDWKRFEKYMQGMMRGTAQALDRGMGNSLFQKGDSSFRVKNPLIEVRKDTEDIQKKIDRHQVGTYVAVKDGPDSPGVYEIFMNPDAAGHLHPTYHHVQGTRDWLIYCNARAVGVTGAEFANAKKEGLKRGDPLPRFKA